MADHPVLLITRKLPDAVEARAARDYTARLNASDIQYDADALISNSAGVDAILTCSTEAFSASVITRLPERVRAVATFSVGYEHIDIDAAKAEQAKSTEMIDMFKARDYIPTAKAVMALVGVDCGPVRPPLKRLSKGKIDQLRLDLDAMGFFNWAVN